MQYSIRVHSPSNPRQNSLVETGFACMLNKENIMMIDENVTYLQRCKIIQEAVITATKLDSLVTTIVGKQLKAIYELLDLSAPSFVHHLGK